MIIYFLKFNLKFNWKLKWKLKWKLSATRRTYLLSIGIVLFYFLIPPLTANL